MNKVFPFLSWIKEYKKENFSGDLSAGITVGVMLVPQGMAYAMLAGMPAIYGLYASIVPLIIYALFGSSRQLAVGPVAMVSLLIASGVGAVAELHPGSFISLAILLSLIIGVIQLLMGLLRMGFLVNFLSHPVIAGFTSAAAIIIGFSQLKHLLGIDIERGSVFETLSEVFNNISDVNLWALGIGVGSVLLILGLKKWLKKIPAPLVVVLFGILIVYFLKLNEIGVSIVGEVPAGLPKIGFPDFSWEKVWDLLPIALTISLIGFMESIAVAKAIQKKHTDYEIVPNQELTALGLANIGGSFFQAFPTTGGFSRTAVNDQAGAKTGLASIISALLVLMTLLFLTSYFFFLPKAVLAAIIMVAVFGLIDFKEAKHLWKTDKTDFIMFMVTAIATLVLGVEEGIGVGVVLSLIMVIYRVSYPHIAEIANVKGTNQYRNIDRYGELERNDDIMIVRFDGPLFFANLNHFTKNLSELEKNYHTLKVIVINAKAITGLDSSAVHMLEEMVKNYRQKNIEVRFSGVRGPVRDILHRSGLETVIGEQNFFLHVDEAVQDYFGVDVKQNKRIILQSS